jgi:hypothetical protein
MGFAITWLAVDREGMDLVLAGLSLNRTGKFEDHPESPFSMARLTSGWQLLWINDYDAPILAAELLEAISRDQDVLVCRIEEHVMASSAELWSSGQMAWSISHVGTNGPVGLDIVGQPPASLLAIRGCLEAAQVAEGGMDAEVDHIFDIPLQVARSLVGFKHDEDYEGAIEGQFEVLASAQGKKTGFMSRLFG